MLNGQFFDAHILGVSYSRETVHEIIRELNRHYSIFARIHLNLRAYYDESNANLLSSCSLLADVGGAAAGYPGGDAH